MRLNRLLGVITVILLLSSFFLFSVTTAENALESRVDASLDIDFVSGTDLRISVEMDVSEITVFGTTYDSNEIQTMAQSTATEDIENMGAIKLRLRQLLQEQIVSSFENANVATLSEKPTYESPVFHDEYSVNLTSAFFGMNETVNAYNLVNGVLDMDAIVSYTFNLQAEPGWNNTFKYILPVSMNLEFANTDDVDIHKNEITWTLENWDGGSSNKSAKLSISFEDPTTSELEIEDISLEFELDASNAETTGLKTIISAKDIDVRDYDILPDFITNLDFVPADGIRLFINNSFISWEGFYQKTVKTVEETTISKIESSSFNQTLDMVFSWDPETTTNCSIPYNVTYMDNNPPMKAELVDNDVGLQICGISTRALFGLTHAGAETNISQDDINFGDKLSEIGYQYNGSLYLADNISLASENIYNWNQSNPISGEFESDSPSSYSNEEIETIVEIEMRSADLNLLSFFTGKTELTLGLYLQESRNYSVTTLPDEFSLPEKVSLEYLNSDAFRLCIEENLFGFGEDNVSAFLTNEKKLFENRLENILSDLEVDGYADRDAFDKSLAWDGDIANMDANIPVKVVSYAHSSYSVPFGLSLLLPNFEISNQSFNFMGLKNQSVTYRVIFPHGTRVEVNDSLGRAVVKETDDGREYIEISFNASESGLIDKVTCKIIPSTLFVVGIFMPCILSLIITIIMIIVILIVRKKRKEKKGIVTKEESFEGYEDQDYYVPPPPSSKE